LEELERAYKAARAETDRDRNRIIREWNELEEKVKAGEASFTEEDEDGQVVWDAGDHAHELMSETDTVLGRVREAFAISLHHLWERQLNGRMKVNKYDEKKVFSFLKAKGLTPDEPMLTVLRLTANVAKHSAGNSANKLYALRPDVFDTAEMAKWSHPPSYEYLRITDQVLTDFFAAVKKSGPQRKKGWA
jgi:hypothetical protein